jgi:hypothetical protein
MAYMKVNINTVSFDELTSLPGIGPKTAQTIIKFRENFRLIDEKQLSAIPHIRMSNQLVDMIDFSLPDSRDRRKSYIDTISEKINKADLFGPRDKDSYRSGPSTRTSRSYYSSRVDEESDPDTPEEETWSHYREQRRPVRQHKANRYSNDRGVAQRRICNIPKTLSYDGTISWKAFQLKFNKFAETQDW